MILHDMSPDACPDLLFDAVKFGLHLSLRGCGEEDLGAARRILRERGVLAGHDPRRLSLRIPLPGGAGLVEAELVVVVREGVLMICNASSITVNPLRLLRLRLADPASGPLGLDGNDNVIGATMGRARPLFSKQMGLVQLALKTVEDTLEAALPDAVEVLREELWLRSAEVCVDVASADALTAVRLLQRAALSGAIITQLDGYSKGVEDRQGVPATRWRRTETGPVFKAYVKRLDLIRAEVACLKPPAIRRLMGTLQRLTFGGAEAVSLLVAFAEAAQPELEALIEHVRRAGAIARSPAQVMAALLPLVLLAGGRTSGRGRPPGPDQVARAGRALDALVTVGSYRAAGPKEGAARVALDALARPGGPLVRHGHHAVYTVRPEFARAVSDLGARFG